MSENNPGRRRPSLSLLLSLVAVVLATSGTAYAVTKAPKGSVVSSSIKNGQVRTADLGKEAVTAPKLAPDTVRGRQLADGSVRAAAVTPVFPVAVTSGPVTDADGTTNGGQHGTVAVAAECPPGATLIGGGAYWVAGTNTEPQTENLYLHASREGGMAGDLWLVEGIVDIGAQGTVRLRAVAYCMAGENLT